MEWNMKCVLMHSIEYLIWLFKQTSWIHNWWFRWDSSACCSAAKLKLNECMVWMNGLSGKLANCWKENHSLWNVLGLTYCFNSKPQNNYYCFTLSSFMQYTTSHWKAYIQLRYACVHMCNNDHGHFCIIMSLPTPFTT